MTQVKLEGSDAKKGQQFPGVSRQRPEPCMAHEELQAANETKKTSTISS